MKKEKRTINHTVIRKIDGKRQVRFLQMNLPDDEKKAFTKKSGLPKFKYITDVHKNITLTKVREFGSLFGSYGLMLLFPEFERSTLGQLVRHHAES